MPGVCYNTDVCITFVRCPLFTTGCFSSCLHIGVFVTHNEWSSIQADSTCGEAFYAESAISGPLLVSRLRLTRDMICPTATSIRTQLILCSSLLGQGQDLLGRNAPKSVGCSMLHPLAEVEGRYSTSYSTRTARPRHTRRLPLAACRVPHAASAPAGGPQRGYSHLAYLLPPSSIELWLGFPSACVLR